MRSQHAKAKLCGSAAGTHQKHPQRRADMKRRRLLFTCGRRHVSKRTSEAPWQMRRESRDAFLRLLTAPLYCEIECRNADSSQAACQTKAQAAKSLALLRQGRQSARYQPADRCGRCSNEGARDDFVLTSFPDVEEHSVSLATTIHHIGFVGLVFTSYRT